MFRYPLAARLLFVLLLFAGADAVAQSRVIVTSTADSGAGTLREAIDVANANADRTTIDFDIDTTAFGPGPWTIALRKNLPPLTAPVLIRGFSQRGSFPPTSLANGRLMIEIDVGASTGFMFVRGAEKSAVSGIAFTGGPGGSGPPPAVFVAADDVRVSSNYIGLRADGTPVGFNGVGVGAICADRVVIGGTRPADGNLFNGTGSTAILLTGSGHVVRNNAFGTDTLFGSTLAYAIVGKGLLSGRIAFIPASSNLQSIYSAAVQQSYFGLRDATIADNRFALTLEEGIELHGTNNPTSGNRIERNIFGRDLWGGPDAYVDIAVRLTEDAKDNVVRDNTIGRANAGILLGDATVNPATLAGENNRLSRNLIFDTAYPLIGLDAANRFAPLANDAGDADAGPNALQNKPNLAAVSARGGIEGALDAKPNATYTVEFFLGATCHPSQFGAADFFLGATNIATDASGRAAFATIAQSPPFGGLHAGDVVSATATDAAGNTSEFSACVTIAPAIATTTKLARLPSPMPAMENTYRLETEVGGSGGRTPTGDVAFVVETATGTRVLGRVPLANGRASIATPSNGFFVNAGRYTVYADYAGDGFHAPSRSVAQTLVVFRPGTALLDIAYSAPMRRDTGTNDREYYDVRARSWDRYASRSDDAWIDADRFFGDRLDRALLRDGNGRYALLSAGGARTTLVSNAIGAGTAVLDLVQIDEDVRADAIVQETDRTYHLVHCVFLVDGCERKSRLDVNPEYRYVLSGEFDGDGHADFVWLDPGTREIEIWLTDGTDKPLVRQRVRPPRGYDLVAASDVDADGDDDLVWLDRASGLLAVGLVDAGTVARFVPGSASSAGAETPGSTHVALPGDRDYGYGHLAWLDVRTGDAYVWRDPRISGGQFTAQPQSLYTLAARVLERTR